MDPIKHKHPIKQKHPIRRLLNRQSLMWAATLSVGWGAAGCSTPAEMHRSDDFYQTRLNVTTGAAEESAAAVKRISLLMKKAEEDIEQTRTQVQDASDALSRQQFKLKRLN